MEEIMVVENSGRIVERILMGIVENLRATIELQFTTGTGSHKKKNPHF
jgi:hypothetical protein